jgi:hypothetical protein
LPNFRDLIFWDPRRHFQIYQVNFIDWPDQAHRAENAAESLNFARRRLLRENRKTGAFGQITGAL